MENIIRTRLTISRSSRDKEEGQLYIEVSDEDSGIKFLRLEVENSDFVDALLGVCEVKSVGKVRNLDLVGKTKEQKSFSVRVPARRYDDRSGYAQDLRERCPDGWEVNYHLNSQNSITDESGGMVTLNTYIYRYLYRAT